MYPTPYPDVNATLDELLCGAQAVLGSRFVGMYLYGSLAGGDFNPASSDIDFVVVTDSPLPDETVNALGALHARLAAGGLEWASKLEGSYISRQALRRQQLDVAPCPQINEGSFYVAAHGEDWVIQRDVLRRQGVTLAGPPPQTLIDPVTPDELREAVLGVFHGWWEPMLADPARLQREDYRVFAVLSMCRVLYTLQHGAIASKPVSARWAQQQVGQHAELIQQALQWQHPLAGASGAPFDHLDETLALMRYTQAKIKHFEKDADNG
ncbi:MAG: aminoglycoside adenylyltransferase domain-containing protein [Anaerolineales bacterium]